MPQSLFLIPLGLMALAMVFMVLIFIYEKQGSTKKVVIFVSLFFITGMSIPLSASFAQFKTEMTVTVSKNGKSLQTYKNVHGVNPLGHGLYEMTDHKGKTFKVLVNTDEHLKGHNVHTYKGE